MCLFEKLNRAPLWIIMVKKIILAIPKSQRGTRTMNSKTMNFHILVHDPMSCQLWTAFLFSASAFTFGCSWKYASGWAVIRYIVLAFSTVLNGRRNHRVEQFISQLKLMVWNRHRHSGCEWKVICISHGFYRNKHLNILKLTPRFLLDFPKWSSFLYVHSPRLEQVRFEENMIRPNDPKLIYLWEIIGWQMSLLLIFIEQTGLSLAQRWTVNVRNRVLGIWTFVFGWSNRSLKINTWDQAVVAILLVTFFKRWNRIIRVK
jgi:hypothetical protein